MEAMTPRMVLTTILYDNFITAKTLAEKIQVCPQRLYDIKSGKAKSIPEDIAKKLIGLYPEYQYDWVRHGTAPKSLEGVIQEEYGRTSDEIKLEGLSIDKMQDMLMNMSHAILEQEKNIRALTELVTKLTNGR